MHICFRNKKLNKKKQNTFMSLAGVHFTETRCFLVFARLQQAFTYKQTLAQTFQHCW